MKLKLWRSKKHPSEAKPKRAGQPLLSAVRLKIKMKKLDYFLRKNGITYLTPVVAQTEDECMIIYGRYSGYYANTDGGPWEVIIEGIHEDKKTSSADRGMAVYCYEIQKITESDLREWVKIEANCT